MGRRLAGAVSAAGLREYYDPFTGAGMGATDFSWSALVMEFLDPDRAREPAMWIRLWTPARHRGRGELALNLPGRPVHRMAADIFRPAHDSPPGAASIASKEAAFARRRSLRARGLGDVTRFSLAGQLHDEHALQGQARLA